MFSLIEKEISLCVVTWSCRPSNTWTWREMGPAWSKCGIQFDSAAQLGFAKEKMGLAALSRELIAIMWSLGLIIQLGLKKTQFELVIYVPTPYLPHLKGPVWAQGHWEGEAMLKTFLQLRRVSLSSPLTHKRCHLIVEISWDDQAPLGIIESNLWPIPTTAASPECHPQTFLKHLPNGASTTWAAHSDT